MDLNIFIVFLVGFSTLQALWHNLRTYDPKYNSGQLMVASLTILLLAPSLFFFPEWGAWFILAFWLLFGYAPPWLKYFSFRAIDKNNFETAIWLQRIAHVLHPFNQYPSQVKITESMRLEKQGDFEAAIAILLEFEADPQWRVYAMPKVFGRRRQYPERLAWLRENLSDKDYQRDPTVLAVYITNGAS